MIGVVVTTDGTAHTENFGVPLYKTVGEAVGGYIEIVHPKRLKEPFVMIVNEEGLSLNPIASVLYETDKHGNPIVGDVVILKDIMTEEGPDIGGLTEEEAMDVVNLINQTLFGLSKN